MWNESHPIKAAKTGGRCASVVLNQNLAAGKIRDYCPKASFLCTWGVGREYWHSDQNLRVRRTHAQGDKKIGSRWHRQVDFTVPSCLNQQQHGKGHQPRTLCVQETPGSFQWVIQTEANRRTPTLPVALYTCCFLSSFSSSKALSDDAFSEKLAPVFRFEIYRCPLRERIALLIFSTMTVFRSFWLIWEGSVSTTGLWTHTSDCVMKIWY